MIKTVKRIGVVVAVLILTTSLSGCVSTGYLQTGAYGSQVDYFCDRYISPDYYWDGYYSYRDAFGGRYYYDRDGDYYFYDSYGNCYYYQAYYDRYHYFVPSYGYFLSFYDPHLFFGFYYVGYPWFPSFYFHNHYSFNFNFYGHAPYWKHHHRKRADWNRSDGGGWMKGDSPSSKAGRGSVSPPPSNRKNDKAGQDQNFRNRPPEIKTNPGRAQNRQNRPPEIKERSGVVPSQDKNPLGPVEVAPNKARQNPRGDNDNSNKSAPRSDQPRSNLREQKQSPSVQERDLIKKKRDDRGLGRDNADDDTNSNEPSRYPPNRSGQQRPGQFEPGQTSDTRSPVERGDNSIPARSQDQNQTLPDTHNRNISTPSPMNQRNSNPQPQTKSRNDNTAQPRSKAEPSSPPQSGDEPSDEPETHN